MAWFGPVATSARGTVVDMGYGTEDGDGDDVVDSDAASIVGDDGDNDDDDEEKEEEEVPFVARVLTRPRRAADADLRPTPTDDEAGDDDDDDDDDDAVDDDDDDNDELEGDVGEEKDWPEVSS